MIFNGINMKKINNKFRGNGSSSSTIYSLNYKFDSNSIAGKISGTALDLIKRYNDFAKDAQADGDYVNAEIFRQYAEHYRKIVTEINERKNQQRQSFADNTETQNDANNENQTVEGQSQDEQLNNQEVSSTDNSEEKNISAPSDNSVTEPSAAEKTVSKKRKSFKIIEISHAKADEAVTESANIKTENAKAEAASESAPKRVYRRRKVAATS